MKLGIMQPYFFPYIGYWQLLNAVDTYVIYDDVNYIKRGWINRNRILVDGAPEYFNVIIQKASQNRLINELSIINDRETVAKNIRMIANAYRKAPYYREAAPVVEGIIGYGDTNLAGFLSHSIQEICSYLGIKTTLLLSSRIKKDHTKKGQEKILAICRELGAADYYNAIGGRKLYDPETFREQGIRLYFLQTDDIMYEQFGNPFQSNLSIIDVMMFNPVEKIREMLAQFTLIE